MARAPGAWLHLPAWAWPLLALPVVGGIGLWTYRAVAAEVRAQLEGSLRTVLAANVSALRHWLDAEANLAAVMATDPRVRADVQALLELARRTAGDAAALRAAPAQVHLREVLAPVVSRQENAGYFVVDPAGLIVARVVDERVGDRAVLTVADATAKALGGTPVFLPPTQKQRFAAVPMAFLMASIPGANGRPIAVLAWRILPQRMGTVLNAAPMGRTGETYAVDADGVMVTRVPLHGAGGQAGPPAPRGRWPHHGRARDPRSGGRARRGSAPEVTAEELAPHVGGGRCRGRPVRRQGGRLSRLPRRGRGGRLAVAARMGHRPRLRDRP
jgi:hypothetical protein